MMVKNINKKPLVSIIILNWNGEKCIEQCIDSVLSQTYDNFEVIVVDNASTDKSPEIVKKKYPMVKLIINNKNLGVAKGLNVGIKASKGELIAILNNDVVLHKDWLLNCVNEILSSNDIGIVGGITYYYDPKDIIWAAGARVDLFSGFTWHISHGEKNVKIEELNDIDYIPSCAIVIKKEIFDKIGLLDEHYFLYFDETDYCMCAKKMGCKCKIIPSAIVWHMVSFSWKKEGSFGYYHTYKSGLHFILKHFPIKYILSSIFIQFFIMSIFEILIFRYPLSYLKLKLKAILWNIKHLNEIIKERRFINKLSNNNGKVRIKEVLKLAKIRISERKLYDSYKK